MALGQATERTFRERGPGAGLGALAILGVLVLARLGGLEAAELAVADRIGPAARGSTSAAKPSVVLVSIGEEDFERSGYPIPDAELTRALEALRSLGASAIGLDLYRPTPAGNAPDDLAGWAALAAAVEGDPRIVVTELLPSPDAPGIAAPRFAPREQIGFNNILIDPGRVVRRGYLYAWDDDGTAHVSFALRLASLHLASRDLAVAPDPADPEAVRLGATPLPPLTGDFGAYVDLDAGGYQIPLDFARDLADFESVAFEALLAGRVPEAAIRDRIVLVGTDAPSVKDDFDSPSSRIASVTGHRIHAQLVDQLVRAGEDGDRPPSSLGTAAETALVVGFGLVAVAIATGVGTLGAVVPALLVGGGLPFAFAALLFAQGLFVPSGASALAWGAGGGVALGLRMQAEARAQRQLVSLFRRFSSSAVADELWRQRDAIMAGGRPRPQRVVLTALIADLEGFTRAAEKLEPERLLDWIDGYLAAMTRIIERHGGHVDDYAGDGIKANFGVPIPSESDAARARDARQAVACALAMGEALAECHRDWAARGLPLAHQRIGLFTGPAVVGAVGSDARMKYTSVGDTINAAARLEAFAAPPEAGVDEGPQRILIGESTRRLLGDAFRVEDLGVHGVKGRSEPIRIYRVLGARSAGPPEERT
jgi:adenylate cyclase